MDLEHARRVAVEAAEAAGVVVREGVKGVVGVHAKGCDGDVVTDLDLAAEKILLDRVLTTFPDHRVIAEESGLHGGGEWTWLVDPLDGTNNLAIGLPTYVIGVALCFRGRPLLGVIHDPVMSRTWSAVRGSGAQGPGGAPLAPPYRPVPHGPILAWTQGYGVARDDPAALALKITLDVRARRVLRLWAPLLGWVMLARGDIDGIIGYRAGVVDLPAGVLIAQEAGLAVRDLGGGPFDDDFNAPGRDRSFVAGRPELIDALLAMVTAAGRAHLTLPPAPADRP
jgi:myo-inositol-1(or 4)-monophosphatase